MHPAVLVVCQQQCALPSVPPHHHPLLLLWRALLLLLLCRLLFQSLTELLPVLSLQQLLLPVLPRSLPPQH
jgi:hypothetical protein